MTLSDEESVTEPWVYGRENGVTRLQALAPVLPPRPLSPPQRREAGPTVVSSSESSGKLVRHSSSGSQAAKQDPLYDPTLTEGILNYLSGSRIPVSEFQIASIESESPESKKLIKK